MFVVAQVEQKDEPTAVVPTASVRREGSVNRLFAVVDGRIEERLAELGLERDGSVSVLDGVEVSERVVVAPGHEARDGVAGQVKSGGSSRETNHAVARQYLRAAERVCFRPHARDRRGRRRRTWGPRRRLLPQSRPAVGDGRHSMARGGTRRGGRRRQINVLLDVERLQGHGLTGLDVQRALVGQNLAVPGGRVETGPRDVNLRVQARAETVGQLGRIVVRQRGETPVRVEDVATIEDGEEEAESYSSVDGEPVLVLAIQKQSGRNTVAVVDALRDRLGPIEQTLPASVKVKVIRDLSQSIRTQVNNVKEHLVFGAFLAAGVVLVFLGSLRSTVIAALAIPISILGTFALMWLQGETLNVITLLALALSVGILIDNAIVILENILRFVQEQHEKPFPAAILATRDIGLAVLATTLSLLAVFLPIAFVTGIIGRVLRGFGLTMSFAVAVSLLVSFTLTPMLASRWLTPAGTGVRRPVLERLVDWLYRPVERAYLRALRSSLRHRWVIVLACTGALASCLPLLKTVKTAPAASGR